MSKTVGVIAIVLVALPALAGVAGAQYGGSGMSPASDPSSGDQPAAQVGANGNIFTGGLGFVPSDVTVKVGEVVRWTNNDYLVPHTATEDHGLWDLGGTYGETPANPPGFGPGESVQRSFAAGTFSYFCRVHPTQMRGTVAVPVKLRQKHKHRRFRVIAVWANSPLPGSQVFDVKKRKGAGPWRTVRDGTRRLRGRFRAGKGQKLAFQVRVRDAEDSSAASGFSPPAKITVG